MYSQSWNSGDDIAMSAVDRFRAMGTFHTVAKRSRALTSGSCGAAANGSAKNTSRSSFCSAMSAPSCWSPPNGPDSRQCMSSCRFSEMSFPVVPVPIRLWWASVCRLNSAQFSRSGFLASCATNAMLIFSVLSSQTPLMLLLILVLLFMFLVLPRRAVLKTCCVSHWCVCVCCCVGFAPIAQSGRAAAS